MKTSCIRARRRRSVAPFALALAVLTSVGDAAALDWRLGGVELNPVRALDTLTSVGDSGATRTLSGGLHFSDGTGRGEIAVPVGWYRETDEEEFVLDRNFSVLKADVQYRRFIVGSGRGGLYLGPLLHVSHVEGTSVRDDEPASATRYGLGLVIGFRKSLPHDFYWGMAVVGGRFAGTNPGIDENFFNFDPLALGEGNSERFTDIEVLKFGKRF